MTTPTFFCENIHNFEEVKSPNPKLCLHCFNLKINDDFDADIVCNCGCNGVCPECEGERFCEYSRGEEGSIEGCQVCNKEGYIDDDDDDAWRGI